MTCTVQTFARAEAECNTTQFGQHFYSLNWITVPHQPAEGLCVANTRLCFVSFLSKEEGMFMLVSRVLQKTVKRVPWSFGLSWR